MIRFYKTEKGKLMEIPAIEKDCWVNISPPFNPENLKKLSTENKIPLDFLIDSIDIDERSRFEKEDDIDLLVLKSPISEDNEEDQEALIKTVPIGIIITPDIILTISAYDNNVIEDFIEERIKQFNPLDKKQFVLKLFDRTVHYFLQYLKEIDNKQDIIENELQASMKNEKLLDLLTIKKSLVYFVTSLRSNEMMMMKLHRTNQLSFNEDELDEFQDIIVDNSQAHEMANIYSNILNSTMDAFGSLISNNLNTVIRRLTSVTIILMIPTLVASFYGMNVKLPFEGSEYAFLFTIMISILLIIFVTFFFVRRKMF